MVGDRAERDQFGARDVAARVLVGFTDVDDRRARGEAVRELLDVDLPKRHGARLASSNR